MEGGIFGWVEQITPLWWVAIAFGLAALEMVVFSFFLIWPAMAALVMAITVWLSPGIGGELQIILFAILSIALTFSGRRLFQWYDEPESSLNDRAKQLIGKRAKVVSFEHGEGRVELNGLRWPAKWAEGQSSTPGDTVVITNADGMSVQVEPA